MRTKVIALDIYGTVLSSDDPENSMPPRKGFKEFVQTCQNLILPIATVSDAYLPNLGIDLEESLKKINLTLGVFNKFYHLPTTPKNFSEIILDYRISPQELLVIGNNPYKDIEGARLSEARYFQVPEYIDIRDEFDFSEIEIL